MNRAVAPSPRVTSAGVASTGARKNPALPPAAKMLIAEALPPASARADVPAAGWNMATPRPDSRMSTHTAKYGCTRPDSPRPSPAVATPAAAIQPTRMRSTSTPRKGCGIELPSVAAKVRPEAAT